MAGNRVLRNFRAPDAGDGSAAGIASVAGVGIALVAIDASSSSVSVVNGVGVSLIHANGIAAGAASSLGALVGIFRSEGIAEGISSADAVGDFIDQNQGIGSCLGIGSAAGVMSAIAAYNGAITSSTVVNGVGFHTGYPGMPPDVFDFECRSRVGEKKIKSRRGRIGGDVVKREKSMVGSSTP